MRSGSPFGGGDGQAPAEENRLRQNNDSHRRGQIAVVGLGPGSLADMSRRAADAIAAAEVVVGYDTYLGLIGDLLPGKKVIGTGMTQEIDRCQAAVEEAMAGRRVAVVSSGDPGVYGMAGLVLELVLKYPEAVQPEVAIIPGISAMTAAAALLGAPVMHDFAVISLSDLLTPWDTIVKRVEMAAAGDFVIALYNPKSTRRVSQIEQVREIVLRHRPATTPVGIVRQASRENESVVIANLDNFTREHIDMFSLVIIGNSRTYTAAGKMITPRGYSL